MVQDIRRDNLSISRSSPGFAGGMGPPHTWQRVKRFGYLRKYAPRTYRKKNQVIWWKNWLDGSWNVKVARKVAYFYQVISENHNAQLEKLK